MRELSFGGQRSGRRGLARGEPHDAAEPLGLGRARRRPAAYGRTAAVAKQPSDSWPSGEKVEGRLLRIDDFLVTVALEDGTARTIRRDGDVPAVVVTNPLAGHQALLAILTDKDMHDVTAYLATLK